jgi:CO/xanthine dehydrogenase FAD-binding subunit
MSTQFFEPQTIDDAVSLLRQYGPDAFPLAGGTDLVVQTRQGVRSMPGALVSLGRIPGLDTITGDEDGTLHLGGRVTHGQIERSEPIRTRWTALSDASALVGSPATRYVGTVAGNLCNGSPAMEIGGPLLAFDARVRLVGTGGERTVALADFFVGPRQTVRAPDEVLTDVLVPPAGGTSGSAYLRLEFRRAMEIAIVGATAVVHLAPDGTVDDCRIALTAVAPVIIRVAEAEQALRGITPDEAALDDVGKAAAAASAPIDDVRSPAAYRRDMVRVMTVRALRQALARCTSAKEQE